jgi:hypothetical protein
VGVVGAFSQKCKKGDKSTVDDLLVDQVMIDPPAPPEVAKPTMRDFTIWQAMKSKVRSIHSLSTLHNRTIINSIIVWGDTIL